MRTFNEDSDFTVTTDTRVPTGEAVIPTGLRYRIDCLTTGQEILDWTTIDTPTITTEIVISAALNKIVCCGNARERRQLVVETTSGPNSRNDTLDYWIRNIYGVRP